MRRLHENRSCPVGSCPSVSKDISTRCKGRGGGTSTRTVNGTIGSRPTIGRVTTTTTCTREPLLTLLEPMCHLECHFLCPSSALLSLVAYLQSSFAMFPNPSAQAALPATNDATTIIPTSNLTEWTPLLDQTAHLLVLGTLDNYGLAFGTGWRTKFDPRHGDAPMATLCLEMDLIPLCRSASPVSTDVTNNFTNQYHSHFVALDG